MTMPPYPPSRESPDQRQMWKRWLRGARNADSDGSSSSGTMRGAGSMADHFRHANSEKGIHLQLAHSHLLLM
jgi:hypothetical protein